MLQSSESLCGCKVSVFRGGSGSPLLLLHGAGGGVAAQPLVARLSEAFDVIAPEHPGFGNSDEPSWLDNIHDLAFFYLDFLKHLNLRDVHLVGLSLGGWIALETAVRCTARLASLTLVGTAGVHVPGLAVGDPFMWSPQETIRQCFHDNTLAEEAIRKLPDNVEADDILLKNRSSFARIAWEPRLHNPHLPKWLHRIDVPTQIIWGANDRLLSSAHADAIARMIPGAHVSVIPDAGHFLHIERADQLAGLIRTLVQDS